MRTATHRASQLWRRRTGAQFTPSPCYRQTRIPSYHPRYATYCGTPHPNLPPLSGEWEDVGHDSGHFDRMGHPHHVPPPRYVDQEADLGESADFQHFSIIPLGTNSGHPTKERGVSCTLIALDGQTMMVDCGEGSQTQLARLPKPNAISRISNIFITHLHGDHILGLPGVILSLCGASRYGGSQDLKLPPLQIFGPRGLRYFVSHNLNLIPIKLYRRVVVHELQYDHRTVFPKAQNVPHPQIIKESDSLRTSSERLIAPKGNNTWKLFKDERYTVTAAPLMHTVPCFGYIIKERNPQRNICIERAAKLGLTPGLEFKYLKGGRSLRNKRTGGVVTPHCVLNGGRSGRKAVILGDTYGCPLMKEHAMDADVIYHEATLDASASPKEIREKGHSTPVMAADFAMETRARRLLLSHFGSAVAPEEAQSCALRHIEAHATDMERRPFVHIAEDMKALHIPRN